MKKDTILKLRQVFSLGYVWSRGLEHYHYVLKNGLQSGTIINCFSHACFNLTNRQLDILDFNMDDYYVFRDFYRDETATKREIAEELFTFVEDVGIKVERKSRDRILKKNQTVVALYFDEKFKDVHFIKLEEFGWSSKPGIICSIDVFDEVPERISPFYDLYDTYILTNKKSNNQLEL